MSASHTSRDGTMILALDEIVVPSAHRAPDPDTVKWLADSIKQIGLQHPITVRPGPGKQFTLIAGRHRFEAVRALREESIRASIMKADNVDARLWEISENLHRAELTVADRANQITEYGRLVKEKREAVSVQLAPKLQVGRPESGDRMASRELGITREEVRRAEKIAGIAEEAKEAYRGTPIDDNQSKLLIIASAPAEKQVAVVAEMAEAKARKPISPSGPPRSATGSSRKLIDRDYSRMNRAWNLACAEAREKFRTRLAGKGGAQ